MANFQRRAPPLLGASVLFAVLIAWMFWPVLTGEATFVHGDSLSVSLPLQQLLAQGLSQGHIPQWSDLIYGGHPVLAEGQGGFLHPLNLLLFGTLPRLFDAAGDPVGAGTLYAHGLLHLICTLIAAVGCFGLGRALGLGVSAALFGSLALALSQDWLGLSGNSAIAVSTSFVPLAAWAAERWWQSPSPRTAVVFGACVALLLLGGYPQAAHALAIVCLLVFALRTGPSVWQAPGRHVATGLLAVAVALGLAAMQLLPTLELVSHSVRAEGVELAYTGSPLRQLRGLLFSGGRLSLVEPGLGSLLVLLLAGLGIRASRARLAWALAAVVLFQLGIADQSPLYRALHGVLPGLDSFRITHLYSTVGLLGISLLAGFGVQRLSEPTEAPRALGSSAAIVALVLLGLSWVAHHEGVRAIGYGFPVLAGFVSVALLACDRRRWLGPALVALLILEIAVLREPLHDFVPSEVASEPPTTATFLLERHPDASNFRVANVPHFFSYIGFAPPDTEGLDRLAWLYLASLDAGSNLLWGIPSLNANLALPLARRRVVESLVEREVRGESVRAVGERFIDVQAVRYIVARERQKDSPYAPDLRRVFQDPETRFYLMENAAAAGRLQLFPRARVRWVPDLEAAVASWDSPEGAGAVLEGEEPPPAPAVTGYGARIVSASLSAERIRVEIEGAEAVHLVLADAPYPGWTARLDGEPVPIVPANVLGKAVAVPHGRHEVLLEFRSRSFVWGAELTSLTGLALAFGFVWTRRRVAR